MWLKKAFPRIASFDQNPESGTKPVMARVEIPNVSAVSGIFRASPPMLRMSVSSPIPCITEPAPRKRQPLKKAWVTRWRMPAHQAPQPTPMNMKPSWLTVE